MNFWQHQDKARSNTNLLVILFTLAVLIIAGLIGSLVYILFDKATSYHAFWCFIITLSVILIASIYRTYQLKTGGTFIAKQIGATFIGNKPQNPKWLRLRNVTTEIAIASRITPPKLYVLENENALNAFTAGHDLSDAIIVVTEGMLEHLNRDELQAVIAHEVGHILNKDIHLNLRIIGVLHGILMISELGKYLIDIAYRGNTLHRKSTNLNRHTSNRLSNYIAGIGLLLVVIGYVGLLSGRLIKAAISRQRELLADACAVQFTRQKLGLADALKKIAAHPYGSELNSQAMAEEFSHMLILTGYDVSKWLDSHPPIVERIKILDPSFNATKLTFLQRKLEAKFNNQ